MNSETEIQKKYRLLTENSPNAIVLHNRTHVLNINTSGLKLIGAIRSDEIIGKPAIDFVHSDDKATAQKEMIKLFNGTAEKIVIEQRFVRLDGAIIDVEIIGLPLAGEKEPLIQLIIRDISESKKTKRALEKSEKRFRNLFEKMIDGFALHEIIVDKNERPIDYRFLEINPAFTKLTGITKDSLQKTVKDVFPTTEHVWIERFGKVALTGAEDSFEQFSQALGKWFKVTAYCPQYGQFACICEDITEQKKAEENLEKSEERFRELLKLLPQVVFEIDLDGNTTFLNDQAYIIFGYPTHSIDQRKNILDIIIPEDRERATKGIQKVLNEGSLGGNVYRFLKNDGSLLFGMVSSRRILDSTGQIVGLRGILTDVTQLKHLEEELRIALKTAQNANKAKSQFLAKVSHELRTPLNGILGFSELLKNKHHILDEETKKNYAFMIHNSGKRLYELINDILDISTLEVGRAKLSNNSFDLYDVFLQEIEVLQLQTHSKEVEIKYFYADDMIRTFIGDRYKIGQIIGNLLGNALKFTHTGTITLSVWSDEPNDDIVQIFIEVKDTGIGIATENIEDIFTPFNQVEEVYTRKYEGSGLGLSITRELVDLMGGNIEVKSTLNEGSTFTVSLPMKINKHLEKTQKKHAPSKTTNTTKILLAEDEEINQMLIAEIIKDMGFRIDMAKNGHEAVHMIMNSEKDEYSLIFMDVKMPILDGIDATKALRKKGVCIPIIALTAHAYPKNKAECLDAGMDDYIPKPINLETLQEKVHHWTDV